MSEWYETWGTDALLPEGNFWRACTTRSRKVAVFERERKKGHIRAKCDYRELATVRRVTVGVKEATAATPLQRIKIRAKWWVVNSYKRLTHVFPRPHSIAMNKMQRLHEYWKQNTNENKVRELKSGQNDRLWIHIRDWRVFFPVPIQFLWIKCKGYMYT